MPVAVRRQVGLRIGLVVGALHLLAEDESACRFLDIWASELALAEEGSGEADGLQYRFPPTARAEGRVVPQESWRRGRPGGCGPRWSPEASGRTPWEGVHRRRARTRGTGWRRRRQGSGSGEESAAVHWMSQPYGFTIRRGWVTAYSSWLPCASAQQRKPVE